MKSNAEFGEGEYHKYTQYPYTYDCEVETCEESIDDLKAQTLLNEQLERLARETSAKYRKEHLIEPYYLRVRRHLKGHRSNTSLRKLKRHLKERDNVENHVTL